jgi:hypothetical protein
VGGVGEGKGRVYFDYEIVIVGFLSNSTARYDFSQNRLSSGPA